MKSNKVFAALVSGVLLLGVAVSMEANAVTVARDNNEEANTQANRTNKGRKRTKVRRATHGVEKGTKDTGKGVARAGEKTGERVAKGSKVAAKATADGARDASKATANGVEKTGRATEIGAKKVGRGFKKVGKKIAGL